MHIQANKFACVKFSINGSICHQRKLIPMAKFVIKEAGCKMSVALLVSFTHLSNTMNRIASSKVGCFAGFCHHCW